jgi:uncharacterized protein (TIGR00255 family)
MTGYGQAEGGTERWRFVVELRGVNHRYADLRIRVPETLHAWEGDVRRRVGATVRRGRVEVLVGVGSTDGAEARPTLNRALLGEALAAARIVADEHGVPGRIDVASLLGLPGMFRADTAPAGPGDVERAALLAVLDRALAAFDAERAREGADLARELAERAASVRAFVDTLVERAAGAPSRLRDRLVERLEALGAVAGLDPVRVAQEAALLAERADLTEELVRLSGHVDAIRALLDAPTSEPLGKRFDVLLQEAHREANTVCSKAVDLEITRLALAIRIDVERMREQVQNVE